MMFEDIGGDLMQPRSGSAPTSLETFFPFALSLAATLECLHRHQVVYRNIQPSMRTGEAGTGSWPRSRRATSPTKSLP